MSKIAVSVYDQTEVFTEIPDIFSGDVGTDTVEFTFDDSWNEYDERTVIFYNEPKKSYPVILDDTNIAVIPSEVIDRETKFYFGIVGTKANGEVKTSNVLSFRVEKGSLTVDTEVPYPSTDVWLQILANYEYALNKVNDIDVKVDNAITDTDTKLNTMDEKLAEMDQRFIDAGVENKANKNFSNVSDTDFSNKCESAGIPVINKIPVDLTGIYNTQVIGYDEAQGKLVPMINVARTLTLVPSSLEPKPWEITEMTNCKVNANEQNINLSTLAEGLVNFKGFFKNSYIISEFTTMAIRCYFAYVNSATFLKLSFSKQPDFSTIDAEYQIKTASADIEIINLIGEYYIKFEMQTNITNYSTSYSFYISDIIFK